MAKKTGKTEFYRDKRGEWRFRVKASNGRILAGSEGFSSRKKADAGLESLKKHVVSNRIVEAKTTLKQAR